MKYSKWIVAKILVIKFISHGVRSYSASCLKQNAAFLMENLTFCAPGWREFQSSCQGRQMIWWLNQGADGSSFQSPHTTPPSQTGQCVRQPLHSSVDHKSSISPFGHLSMGRKWWTTHRTYYVDIVRYWPNPHTFGSGREMESMCTRWKECVHDHLNAFVWELSSYISDPLQLSSPFSWHSQVAKFKMEDKYLRRVLLWNLENRHTPNMPFTPKLHKIQFRISYKFQ